MQKPKQSFFQRLTGAVEVDDGYDDAYEEKTSDQPVQNRGG